MLEGDIPSQSTEQVRLDGAPWSTCDSTLPIRLILEHSSEIADDVDDAEDQPVLGAHGEVRAMSVSIDGGGR